MKFADLKEKLPPILAYFSRLGELEKFEVAEAPNKDRSAPHGADGCAGEAASDAEHLQDASVCGCEEYVSRAQCARGGAVGDVKIPRRRWPCSQAFHLLDSLSLRLKQRVQSLTTSLVVLQNFPTVDSQAHAFVDARRLPEQLACA